VTLAQILAVNGITLKTPASVTYGLQDISGPDAGRSLDGVAHTDFVAQKVKLTCKWAAMPAAEASVLLRNVDGQNFRLTYFDIKRNAMRTATFYVGDRSAEVGQLLPDQQIVKNVSFNFIEV
jgi:hypothetical protein